MGMEDEKIDFIVTWVDGTDPDWRTLRLEYERPDINAEDNGDDANSESRYRDLGFLRYWFRGIEQFAPWVNKVYFVTCGQKPEWLNTNHPKLVCVHHRDYIPNQYLPTFNSNTIELNFHRIKGLSERFVLFNDDVFLVRPVSPDYFYHAGNPLLVSTLRYPINFGFNNWSRIAFNDYCLVNRNHKIGDSIWKNRKKWFSVSELEGHRALRNFVCYIANKSLPVGNFGHLAQPHLKSTFFSVWEKCPAEMDHTCLHRFRSDDQVNHWLMCAWNQALGKFFPCTVDKRGRRFHIMPEDLDAICDMIVGQKVPQLCINDGIHTRELETCVERIVSSFDRILPHKSSFELF